mgnify:CR=1
MDTFIFILSKIFDSLLKYSTGPLFIICIIRLMMLIAEDKKQSLKNPRLYVFAIAANTALYALLFFNS